MTTELTALATMGKLGREGDDERLAHLVLKDEWPIALCGAMVKDNLGTGAPGRDRCRDCLKIAGERKLGRPGWGTEGKHGDTTGR